MTTARQRILRFAVEHRAVTALQVARAFGTSAANARHHLGLLSRDGRLAVALQATVGRRGPPEKVYRPSDALEGNNLGIIGDLALSELARTAGGAEIAARILGESLAKRVGAPQELASASRKLASLIERLNAFRYRARWEAGPRGPRIVFGRCPYAEVVSRHPELCRMDALMLSRLTDREASQVSKIGEAGGQACVFVTGPSAGAKRSGPPTVE